MAGQRRLLITALAGFSAACPAGANDDLAVEVIARDLRGLGVVEAADGREIAALQREVQGLRAGVEDVVTVWRQATRDLERAQADYRTARARARAAGAAHESARTSYDAAARSYRRAATLLIVVAATSAVGEAVCGSTMSTRAYRAELKARGVDLTGVDIDHVWPRALGGADHPLNYQVLDSQVNRSLGADVSAKLLSWPLATVQGFAVSAVAALGC